MKWRDDPGTQAALGALLDTLAGKSGGGGNSLETIAPQGIRGFVLFLDDGRVAAVNLEEEKPSVSGGAADTSLHEGRQDYD
ncbi:hypothetical protein D1641_01295 [Colidextribacter sp. OB.20]|uniref:hypothetical protein n=1 Tax=Colidextribacter sp. OB.20 TaxID=2304568 RepID=UPI00136EA158|nr:hypothetical protein [Colidextribacter sp. OB.20]NBI08655.1 hypothetical protein [Colidextribacter sp. OB.20]